MRGSVVLGGRYALEAAVATDSTGTTFRARDRETGERVAVKRFASTAPEDRGRLERDLATIQRLRHDAIIACNDAGTTETGEPYLVMEALDGESLGDRLRRGQLDLEEALVVASRVLAALAEAHAIGIVHRDVHPANIFLPGGHAASAKLLNFDVGRRPTAAGPPTGPSDSIGTAGYVAPEQVQGERVDARADIYSVGCVLFRCLTGRDVFEGDNALDLLIRATRDAPPPLRDLRKDLPPALTLLVDSMLARNAVDRPTGAAEALDRLEALRAHAPQLAKRPFRDRDGPEVPGYRIGRLLGEGAMGRVHEATRLPDGARFAAKILVGDTNDTYLRRGLVNEAVAMADLHHPNIVEVIELVGHPLLGLVLITELVEGRSLHAATDLGLVGRLRIIEQVLTGLSAAHAQGVVHGDLKPSNILISQSSIAKICDFGIAQVLGPTKDGGLRRINAGTPLFMAPEQFDDTATLQPRTDLYAIGVLVHQAVVGQHPWKSLDLAGLCVEKLKDFEPPKFDAWGRPLPRTLTSLIASLCQPRPELRLRFALEALQALEVARAEVERNSPAAPDVLPARPSPATIAQTELLSRPITNAALTARAPAATIPGAEPALFVARGAGLPRTPVFFGRDLELRTIRQKMAEVVCSRKPKLIFITGERGVGKSRLGDWAVAEAERQAMFESAAASFSAGGTAPLRGLRGIVQRLLDAGGGSRVQSALDHLRAVGALTITCDAAAIVHWLSTSADTFLLDAHTAAGLALEAIKGVAGRRPVLLWLDNLAHATDGTIELLRAVLDSEDLPIILIAASEESDVDRSTARPGLKQLFAESTVLRLERLSRELSIAVLKSMVAFDHELPDPTAALDGLPHRIVALGRDYLARAASSPSYAKGSPFEWTRAPEDLADRWIESLTHSMGERFALLLSASLVAGHLTTRLFRALAREFGLTEASADLAVDETLLAGVLAPDGGEHFKFSSETMRTRLQHAFENREGVHRMYGCTAAALTSAFGQDRPDVVALAARLTHAGGNPQKAIHLVFEAADVIAFGGDLTLGRSYHSLGCGWLAKADRDDNDPLNQLRSYVEARLRYFALDYVGALETVRPLLSAIEASSPDSPIRLKATRLVLRSLFYADRLRECEAELRRVAHVLEIDSWGRLHALHLRAHMMALRGDLIGCASAIEAGLEAARKDCPEICIVFSAELAEMAAARGDAVTAKRRLVETELLVKDVYEAINVASVRRTVLTLLGEPIDRSVWIDAFHSCRRRDDKWRLTAVLAQLALHDLGSRHPDFYESVCAAITAFEEVPHDEPPTQAALARLSSSPSVPEPVRARIVAALARRRAAATKM